MSDTNPVTIYFTEHPPAGKGHADEPGWWWCIANFDPCGPFETRTDAVRNFLYQLEGKRQAPTEPTWRQRIKHFTQGCVSFIEQDGEVINGYWWGFCSYCGCEACRPLEADVSFKVVGCA